LPRFFTLESFVAEALQYSPRQKPRISGPERLLRLAGAWQELTGRSAGPGVIRQLDRYIRDCQACGVRPSTTSKDAIDRLVNRYLSELNAPDGWLDRMSAAVALTEEISELESWPNRIFFERFEGVLFDGFHRLEPVELDLIAALGKVRDVVLWLVGNPGTPAWETVKKATEYLKDKSPSTLVRDQGFEDSAPAIQLTSVTPFAEIGRRLFRSELDANLNNKGAPLLARRAAPPGLFKLEVDTPLDEAEEAARHIKADYLDSQNRKRPLRLSDVAVIIPGPDYDPLIREVFPRAGLEFNLAGRALEVSTSRPARVLLAAIDLIQGHWRYDLLLDFLNQPLVRRKLEDAHRLNNLFEQRPRARQRMNHELWSKSWKKQLERLHHSIEGWRSGRLDLPERTALSREEYVAHKTELAAGLERLIESIERILKPIDAIARAIAGSSQEKPLSDLIQVMKTFLDELKVYGWLSPRASEEEVESNEESAVVRTAAKQSESELREGPVLWVEYEKDQNAYRELLNILESLKNIPTAKLPQRAGEPGGVSPRSPDVLAALRLALDGETYQIKTEDDAGVQIFELREIRGLRFRHVYVLGLVNGQIPSLPEEGTLVRRQLDDERLKEQLKQKEAEVQFLFSQVFEAAQEKLVLSRFKLEGDRPALPSPFFTAVDDLVTLPDLPDCQLVTGMGQAARELGRAFLSDRVARPESSKGVVRDVDMPFEALWRAQPTLTDLWPSISPQASEQLAPVLAGLSAWHQKSRDVTLDWPEMLLALFPDDHQFSPSQLEAYAACPFRFFGSRVLHLEEREADPTRMHYGSLVHRVLQKFYQEKRQKTGTPDDQPLPATQQSDRARLIQLFDEEKSQLDEGLLPPDLEKLFVVQGGVIDLLLEILASIEGEEVDFGVLSTEYPLEKVSLGKDATGRPVLLTGKIDRVDLKRSDLQTALIIDYKTGKVPKPVTIRTKVGDGRLLQLSLYAAALQIDRLGTKVVGAAYAHLNERPKATLIRGKDALASIGEPFAGQKDPELWNTQTALELALSLASRIRAGGFPLTRHGLDSDEAECTAYCPLRHACRHPEGYATSRWR
jgi:ATP-dependent helicase/DNAse subunit B